MRQRTLLCFLHVLKQGAGGGHTRRSDFQVETFECFQLEVAKQFFHAVVDHVTPRRPFGDDHVTHPQSGPHFVFAGWILGHQQFRRPQAGEFVGQLFQCQVHRGKPAAGQLEPCQPDETFRDEYAGQVVAFAWVEQGFIGQGARGDDLSHLAFDHPRCFLRVFNLLTDRSPVPGTDQLVQVVLQRVIREPGHRYGIGRTLVPTGQSQAQDLRSDLGVFKEQLVEVSHAEEQQRAGVLRFDLTIAFQHRGQFRGSFVLFGGHSRCSRLRQR